MFLQAGGGGKGIRPIQQNQQQQASQQQSQQHQNQIPSHHQQQQQQQQAIITSSNLQTHHLSSQSSNQQLHHGHHHQPQQQQHQQQQQQHQQHHQQQHHQQQQHQQSLQQQQSSVHLGNIQAPLLPQPHHQQATLQHPPPHHHTPLPYYTYQLSQAAQPQPLQPPTHQSHHHQQQQQHLQQQHPQQQQIANNGANAAQPLVITPGSTSSGNVSSSSSAINSNNSNNNNSNNAGQLLRQHTATAANNIQTMYTPNAAALLQSPTANPGFMTPYMQQYPIQTAVIAAAAAAAQYPTNQPNNGGAVGGGGGVGSNNHNANGHNNQNNGPQAPPPQSAAAVYQMAQQTHQQQPLMQYFHPSAAGVTGGPPPTAPPHLHPNQPQFRSVLTSGHAQHHNAPPAYLLSAPTTTLYAMPPGQLTAGPAQRASLLPAPGQPTNGAANGNIPMSQLMQAASTPTGATTFMPAAFCTAPIGMTHGPLAGTAPLMTSGAALGPSPLQTYSHLTISSSNTSMSSLSEGNIKPRPHAIPIIDPITHENILDPKPLHKSASVEVKPSAPEFSKNNGETDSMTSSTTSVPSKWRDKSITVSIPPSKSSTSTTGPSISSNSIAAAAAAEKIDQQMQTDVKREKHPMSIIKIEDPNVVGERQREITKSKSRDHQEGDAATNWQAEIKAHFPKKSSVGDTDDSSMKDADDDDEKLIIVMEEKKTYVFTRSPKYDQSTGLNILDDEQSNVASTLRGGEHYEGLENENFFEEKIGSNESIDTLKTAVKTQKIIHDKGQQAFIPKNSEQLPAAAAAGGEELVGDASYMKLQATQSNEQNLMITAVYDASTALSSTQSNSSTSSKVVNGRRQNSTGGGGGNKQNTSASASAATSSCSSINSSSATHLVDESNVLLLNCQEDAAAAVAKPHPIQSAATTSTKIFQNQSLQQQQQPQQVLKRQTQQSFQQQQQPMKNTPTTSGASSSTASTPTHQSHHASTDTSITPTPGNNNSKRRRNKRLKEQKKKSETTTNRNQQQQQSQQQQQQQTQQTQKQHQQQQQQQQASSVRHNSNTNLYNNNNNNNNNSNNAGGSCNSNTSNTNNNKNNRKNSSNSLNNNYNNNNTMTTTVTSTSTAAACAPAKTTPTTTTTTNQTDNNNSNTYKSTSCTNVNISSSNGNTFKKNSSSQNSKQHQQHQQQQQQQQYHQHRFNSNNSNNSNSNRSRRSITFGALGSDAGSSISDADSKASIVSYNREINLVDMRCNFSNESTSSSTHLTSPKKNHRHIRAREIVEQYLTTSTGGDNYSDKTNGSDETPIQFLNSSSSACEDDDETNAQLEFRKQQLKLGEHQQLDKYQQPLEFGIGAMALSDIDEVYFGDFTESDYTNRSTKTDDDIELDITITKIFESQKLKKPPMAETIDCLPMRATTSISKDYGNATASAAAHGSKKAATHKGNEKVGASTSYSNRQQPMTICGEAAGGQAAAHQQPAAATSPPSPPSRPKFFRYSFRDLKELANAPESCKPPMIRCQKDNCVSQLFVARQQHHLASSHQAHSSLSSMTLQHLQTYQQISYNESMEFVSGKRRGGGGGGGSGGGGGGSASERMKKHEHLSSGGMPMGGGGGGAGGMGNNIGMMGLMSGGSGSGNSSQQQRKMDIIRVHLSLKEEIKLSECENAWTPDTLRGKSTQRTSSSTLNDDLEAVLKKVRGVLNKLTPNNFDVLLKTMTSISMNTQEKMQQVMLLIFEKTVSEPNFAPTYAKFCKVLFQEIKAESKSLFSTLLITRIQHEFETNVNDADAKHKKLQPLVDRLAACTDPKERIELQAELEDQEYQFRRRAWGTVRFIGEMYKLQSLTSDRVLICIESLLRHGSEEKLEFMCKLLTTVGYLLEAATPEQVQHMTRIDDIFRRMQEIVQRSRGGGGGGQNQAQNQAKISSRVRFMMQDVMDLRARHWDQGPRTGNAAGGSNQSSAGGSSSQQQQQQQQQQMHQQRRKDDKSHGNSGGGMGSSNVHEKQQSRGYSSSVGSSQSAHRQLRSGGGSGGGGGENTHYFMQKNSKQYSQQHQQQHQQPEQKVNIDVNKLKFTRGDEVTTSTTKLGSPSLYLWRTAGRQSASNSSLTTSGSASSTQQQSATVLGAQPSSSSSIASGSGAAGNSNKRQTSNPFEVLDCISPTAAQQQAQAAMSSDGDDTFTDDTEDQTQMGGSGSNNLKYSGKECQQLLDRLVEEVFDVSSANSSWQDEALTIWCNASTKQQVTLLHYLLMDYLHLVSVKRQQREACAKIFKHLLITPEIFNKIVFDEAYAQFSEEFPDLLVDVPDGWVYVFEFIGPILHDDLIRFEDIWQPMWAEDRNFTERFLKAFLNYFTHEYGANYTRDMWHRRYQLDHGQQFLMDEQRWQQFVANNRYDYLLETKSTENKETGQEAECVVRTVPITVKRSMQQQGGGSSSNSSSRQQQEELDASKHIERIGSLLRQKNGSADLAMEYIISSVPINNEFLRGITELFCCDIATSVNDAAASNNSNNAAAISEKERLKGGKTTSAQRRSFEIDIFRKKCLPILRLCVDSNESLELSCLDAIFEILLDNYEEAKANKMICNVFDLFYDTELIPKATFEKWYQTQSLVDDAIEAAGTAAGTTTTVTVTETQNTKSSSSTKSSNKKHQGSQKKQHKQQQQQQQQSIQSQQRQPSPPSSSSSSSNSAAAAAADNNNNPHKISAELHAYMRKLLVKIWCKTPAPPSDKQIVQ